MDRGGTLSRGDHSSHLGIQSADDQRRMKKE